MELSTTKVLNNGVEIPIFGLGVFRSEPGNETVSAVKWALQAGYRMIDTAAAYGNEESVAEGIAQSGIQREDIFITTKLSRGAQRDGLEREAFEESLRLLRTDYIDLYLIHWPIEEKKYVRAWKILESLYREGRIRAIGVSNFHIQHLMEIQQVSDIVPAVNQIELHPLLSQVSLRQYCRERGIAVQAWSPLGGAGSCLMQDKRLKMIGDKYGKSPAQIVLRWDIQSDIITFPKSVHKERILENADVFDFELSEEDMKKIDEMNLNQRTGPDPDVPAY